MKDFELTDPTPRKQKAYRLPVAHVPEMQKIVDEFRALDIIEESNSDWSSNPIVIPKKTGDFRMVVDHRVLNTQTKPLAYPSQNIKGMLSKLHGAKYLSSWDIYKGFHQIPIKESDRHYTAFQFDGKLWQFKRMVMGMRNSPAVFVRMMTKVLDGLIGKICFVYLDDILIFSRTFEEHLEHQRLVAERLRKANLTCRADKCKEKRNSNILVL
jgi:hypothetical protein